MEKVVVAVIDRSGFDPRIVYIEIMAKEAMKTDDVLEAIELSCREFYSTPQGRSCVRDYDSFGYEEFEKYVPNRICEKYGISKIEKNNYVIEVENEALVRKEDLLNEASLEEEEMEL